MPNFSLWYRKDKYGEAKRVDFVANDAGAALNRCPEMGRVATLCRGNQTIAELTELAPGFWRIN